MPSEQIMSLSNQQIRQYKAQAHHLKPIVLLGSQGLTEGVIAEIDRALDDHELIKVKLQAADKTARLQQANDICHQLSADRIQLIGNILILYRKRTDDE